MDGGSKIDDDVVAGPGGTTHRIELGEAFPEPVEQLVHLAVGDLGRWPFDPDALVVGLLQLEPRTDLDRCREDERLSLLYLLERDVRIRDRCELVLPDGLPVVRGDGVLQELRDDRVATDLRVDDFPRGLALAEAGHLDLLGHSPVGGIEVLPEAVGGDLDGQLDLVLVGLFDGGLHRDASVPENSATWPSHRGGRLRASCSWRNSRSRAISPARPARSPSPSSARTCGCSLSRITRPSPKPTPPI